LPLAPPLFWSAFDSGCGFVGSPDVPPLPLLWSDLLDAPVELDLFVEDLCVEDLCVVECELAELAWPLCGTARADALPRVSQPTSATGSTRAVRSLPGE